MAGFSCSGTLGSTSALHLRPTLNSKIISENYKRVEKHDTKQTGRDTSLQSKSGNKKAERHLVQPQPGMCSVGDKFITTLCMATEYHEYRLEGYAQIIVRRKSPSAEFVSYGAWLYL